MNPEPPVPPSDPTSSAPALEGPNRLGGTELSPRAIDTGGQDRGAAIRERALEVLRHEFPAPNAPNPVPHLPDEPVPRDPLSPLGPPAPDAPSASPAPPAPPATPPTETIPARMLNEFVYCPRLFYYEFVEGVFVESADTLRGKAIHQRVDSGTGALPEATKPEGRREKGKGKKPDADVGTVPDAAESEIRTPQSEIETIHSRSVQMGSPRLGVTAKMDLIEVRVGGDDLFSALEVTPVDYKAGAPRPGEEANELWDADKMQLGLQILILRENGYTCQEGVIYYRATKQRVRLPMTAEVEAWILTNIAGARAAAAGAMPPPLADSPKCPRCSLVTVCLPDETRWLARLASPSHSTEPPNPAADTLTKSEIRNQKSEIPPRRLIAARDDERALYLNTPGLRVGRKDELLQVKQEKETIDEVRINDVSHVALFGNIQISTQAVQSLCEAEVPVTYFSMGGWFYGITRGHELKNVFLRIEQFRLARDPDTCLRLARQFVHGKIRNHRTLLMRNHVEAPPATLLKLKQHGEAALTARSAEALLGLEGGAAAAYFEQFGGMLKVEDPMEMEKGKWRMESGEEKREKEGPKGQGTFNFDFTRRTRRPPTDPVNALLSLAYSLLAKDCTLAALAVGFDPYVGFYHQPRFGRPALALDLMEEFRPLVAESTVLTSINTRVLTPGDFVRAGQAVNLSTAGRRRFFEVYEQRMNCLLTHPVFDYKVSYRRALELQARMLAKTLTGEIPEYVPLTTR